MYAYVRAAVLTTALAAVPAAACINETGTTLKGRHVGVDFGPQMVDSWFRYHGATDAAENADFVVARAKERSDFQSLNNLAATAIRLGRPAAAEKLLLSLERRWPGRYETATNLGTAYELLGRDGEALRWIREGIVRNPRSHWGTEWVHVRILEAKVAAAGRPLDAETSLLGLDYGQGVEPKAPSVLPVGNDGEPVTLWGLAEGLRIQLDERTDLVAPPDPIVASLMLDLAALEMAEGSVETAELIYALAIEYGAEQTPLVTARRAAIAEAVERGAMVHEDDRRYGTCAICEPPRDLDEESDDE